MTTIFILVFFVAIIGIFTPQINKYRKKHSVGIAIVSSAFAGACTPANDASGTTTETKNTENDAAATPQQSDDLSDNKWNYVENKDEMRGTTTKFAAVTSENEIDLEFPYGVVSGQLVIRKRPDDGLSVMFGVPSGQILCHSYQDSFISVKFDDGPIRKYGCSDSSDGSSETAFINDAAGFLQRLKSSKTAIVEAEFYQKGNQQFTFKTAGLEWK